MLELMPDDAVLDSRLGHRSGGARGLGRCHARGRLRPLTAISTAPANSRHSREVEFLQGDVSARLPFANGEFTAILGTTAFHHFPCQQDTIRDMARVLAPARRLLVAAANRAHRACSCSIWRCELSSAATSAFEARRESALTYSPPASRT
jgi:SAM-dependent methyltransferase